MNQNGVRTPQQFGVQNDVRSSRRQARRKYYPFGANGDHFVSQHPTWWFHALVKPKCAPIAEEFFPERRPARWVVP